MTPFYRLVYNFFTIIFKLFFRLKIVGKGNLPPGGPYIVAANHVSYLDPPLVGISFGRQVFFMAKVELFKIPILSPLIRWLGAFPVVRESADRKAIKRAITLLGEGKVVGIFPEGSRSQSGEIGEAELGVALLVKKAKVPVIPCALLGTYSSVKMKGIFPVFSRMIVKIGAPIHYGENKSSLKTVSAGEEKSGEAASCSSDKERMKDFTKKIMDALKELQEN